MYQREIEPPGPLASSLVASGEAWLRQAALAHFQKGRFDLIIVDYEMPGMNGDELAVAVKALDPNQPIALITAHPESLQTAGAPLADVDWVIGKPFDMQGLRQSVARLSRRNP